MNLIDRLLADDDEGREALRVIGGLLLGVGAIVLFLRRASYEDPWGDFLLLLVLLLPAIFLYGSGYLGGRGRAQASGHVGAHGHSHAVGAHEHDHAVGAPRTWESVLVVLGLLLLPLALYQFLELIDGDPSASLNTAWIFGVVAAAGIAAALHAGVRYALLIAGLAIVIVVLALVDEILSDGLAGDFGTFRGVCMVIAAGLAAGAFALATRTDRLRDRHAPTELVTAAGLAFLLGAGLLSFTGIPGAGLINDPSGLSSGGEGATPSLFWDLVLLLGSLVLVAFGAVVGARGPVYVGAIGLLIFAALVGLDLDDDSPAGKVIGWPLILLLAAAAAFAASLVPNLRLGSLGLDRLARHGDDHRHHDHATEVHRDPPPPPPPPPPAAPPPPPPAPPPGP